MNLGELIENIRCRNFNIIAIKDAINKVNNKFCSFNNYSFLLRKDIILNKLSTPNIYHNIKDIYVNNIKLSYTSDIKSVLCGVDNKYSILNDKILLPCCKKAEIIYYTNMFARDISGNDKISLESSDDCSNIPMPFSDDILIYGALISLGDNKEYNMSKYIKAVNGLRKKL